MESEVSKSLPTSQLQHRLASWLCTIPYTVVFILILVLFHPLHVVAALFGKRAHKWMLDRMNLSIVWNIRLLTGARYRVVGAPQLEDNRSVILIANHQSMYDIPMMMWECRAREVGFISKKELGRWIPSISFALRRLGSVLIDRRDAAQAVRDIEEFGRTKNAQQQVAVIFPEGTRARDGVVKKFKATGVNALLGSMPDAIIQPVAIKGNWELLRYHFWPIPWGTSIELEFLAPLEPSRMEGRDVAAEAETRIRAAVSSFQRCPTTI